MTRRGRKLAAALALALSMVVVGTAPATAATSCSSWVGGCGAVTWGSNQLRGVKWRNTQGGVEILRYAVAVDAKRCSNGAWYQATPWSQKSYYRYATVDIGGEICGLRLRSTRGRTMWIGN